MPDRSEILAELSRRQQSGQFNPKQQEVWAELERRGTVTTQLAPGQKKFSQEFDYLNTLTDPTQPLPGFEDAAGLAELRDLGVTPDTAVRFASLEIARKRAAGQEIPPRVQEAIFDTYKRLAGRTDLSSRDFHQEITQRQLEARAGTVTGNLQDFAGGVNQSLGGAGASLVGLVDPTLGQDLQEGVNAAHATRDGSIAAGAGTVVGEAGKIAATLATGTLGAAGLFAAQGAGGQRNEVQRLRSEGHEISGLQEAATATGVGAVEGASGYVGVRVFGALGNVFKSLAPGARAAVQSGEQTAVRAIMQQAIRAGGATTAAAAAEGTEEAATQYATNLIRQGVNPEQALEEGLREAFVYGAILSPIGGGLATAVNQGGSSPQGQEQAQDARATPTQTTAPLSPARGLPTAEGIAVRQLEDAQANLGAEQARLARQPAGEGPIIVDPEGRAYTPEQQQNVILDPARQLPPGQQARFIGEPAAESPGPFRPGQDYSPQDVLDYVRTLEQDSSLIGTMIGDGPFVLADLPLASVDPGIAQEGDTDPDKLAAASQGLAAGTPAPPIVAADTGGGQFFVADGAHRVLAAREAGRPTIQAVVSKAAAEAAGVATPAARGGVRDLRPATPSPQSPEAAHRNQQTSDAVVEEADGLVSKLRTKGQELDPATEQEVRKLVDDARRNPLTGGMNRVAFSRVFDAVRTRARKTGKPVSIIALDAANLKSYNDKHSESAGDEYLKRVQNVVAGALRTSKADAEHNRIGDAFHYGGDEWAVVLPDTDEAGAKIVRDRIEAAFGREEIVPGVSAFLVGETTTVAPNSRRQLRSVLDEAAAGMKTRKADIKRGLGEATDRAGAEAAAAQGGSTAGPAPRQTGAVRAAAAEVGRKRRALEELRASSVAAKATPKKTVPLGGTKYMPAHKRRTPRSVEEFITGINSRVRDISASVYNRLMRMEFDTGVAREAHRKNLTPAATAIAAHFGAPQNFFGRVGTGLESFVKGSAAWQRGQTYQDFKLAVLNGDRDGARALLPPALHGDLTKFYSTFQTMLTHLQVAGVEIGDLGPTYWARFVRDHKAFVRALGREERGRFDEAFAAAKATYGRAVLTDTEKQEIVNSVLSGYGPRKPGGSGISSARTRSNERITAEQLDLYVDPLESAFRYVDGAVYAAERSKFLGRNHDPNELSNTVGALVQAEVDSGRIKAGDQDELHDLLHARFMSDMLTMRPWLRNLKQASYLLTLGQFRSTITQFRDVALTSFSHGVGPTVQGTARALRLTRKDHRVVMEELGIHDHGEEFKDVGRIAQSTDAALRANGFKLGDRLGKESRANAALLAFEKAVANPGSDKFREFERKYRPVLGEAAYDQVTTDLQEGKRTEDVRYLLFLDLAEIQPVTMSQMPQAYLERPNGRIFYTLKTFTASQINFARRNVFRDLTTPGRRVRGLRKLARLYLLYGLIGLGVDILQKMMRGQDLSPGDVKDSAVDSLLGVVGLNRYTVDLAKEDPVAAGINYISPPLNFFRNIWTDRGHLWDVATDDTVDFHGLRSPKHIPLIGDLMYFWTPLGRGYELERDEAKAEYKDKLAGLRDEAALMLGQGDVRTARSLLAAYNDARRNGPKRADGRPIDGRVNALTMENLRGDLQRERRDD